MFTFVISAISLYNELFCRLRCWDLNSGNIYPFFNSSTSCDQNALMKRFCALCSTWLWLAQMSVLRSFTNRWTGGTTAFNSDPNMAPNKQNQSLIYGKKKSFVKRPSLWGVTKGWGLGVSDLRRMSQFSFVPRPVLRNHCTPKVRASRECIPFATGDYFFFFLIRFIPLSMNKNF